MTDNSSIPPSSQNQTSLDGGFKENIRKFLKFNALETTIIFGLAISLMSLFVNVYDYVSDVKKHIDECEAPSDHIDKMYTYYYIIIGIFAACFVLGLFLIIFFGRKPDTSVGPGGRVAALFLVILILGLLGVIYASEFFLRKHGLVKIGISAGFSIAFIIGFVYVGIGEENVNEIKSSIGKIGAALTAPKSTSKPT